MNRLARFTKPRWIVSLLLLTLVSVSMYALVQAMRESHYFGRYSLDYYLFIAPYQTVREFPTFGLKPGTLTYGHSPSDGGPYVRTSIDFTSAYSETKALEHYTEYCVTRGYRVITKDTPNANLPPNVDSICKNNKWEIEIYADERPDGTFIVITFWDALETMGDSG